MSMPINNDFMGNNPHSSASDYHYRYNPIAPALSKKQAQDIFDDYNGIPHMSPKIQMRVSNASANGRTTCNTEMERNMTYNNSKK